MEKRKFIQGLLLVAAIVTGGLLTSSDAQAAGRGQPSDWQRFYYYPYVYYPQNFRKLPESYDHLYYRYPVEKQIPVYREDWHNFYPSAKPYHMGHHFILDVF
ncbi:MAG: hypothetical protein KF861_12345 [Planctomycetaceae bacterium]|nr:hypothetical protein [Planctomycetaceae bacterium]